MSKASKNKKSEFILDCSLTMAWCFEDETSAFTEDMLIAVTELTAWVPTLWVAEVSNSLIVAERKKRLSHVKSMAFQECLNALKIEVDHYFLKKPIAAILSLAKEAHLTAYDASYLELAIRKNLPLASLDEELKNAAIKMGVQCL